MENKNKSLGYTIFFDEARDEAFNIMCTLCLEYMTKHPEVENSLRKNHIEGMRELVKDMSEKSHKMGWCKDPSCPLKNGQ